MENSTLSSFHKKKIKDIENYEKENEKIYKKINSLKNKLAVFEKKSYENMSTEEIRLYQQLKIDIENEEKKIIDIESEKNKYYLDTFNCLLGYYEFDINTGFEKNMKKQIFDEYKEIIDEDFLCKNNFDLNIDKCDICHNTMKINYILSHYLCDSCGFVKNTTIVVDDKKKYSSYSSDYSNFNYDRKTHFLDSLNRIQGKNKNNIPTEILNDIKIEIKRLKINKKNITKKIMKDILKKLNYKKYTEDINYIIRVVSGKKFPEFSKDLENKLLTMFKQAQDVFDSRKDKKRSNFLNYSYCIRKFLELLNEDRYLKYIDNLKSIEKIYEQEQIWKWICEELKWEFIPSV